MQEIWKPIEGYRNYEVSNYGNVRNIITGKTLKGNANGKGYLHVMLYNEEHEGRCIMIHRLVAKYFIPNPQRLPQVNHKDECKTNNRADNLEWITSEDNINYRTHNKRTGVNNPNRKPVCCIDKDGNIQRFESARNASQYFKSIGLKVTPSGISKVLRKEIYTYKGFAWFEEGDIEGIAHYQDCFNVSLRNKLIESTDKNGVTMTFGSLCEALRYYGMPEHERCNLREALYTNKLFLDCFWRYVLA